MFKILAKDPAWQQGANKHRSKEKTCSIYYPLDKTGHLKLYIYAPWVDHLLRPFISTQKPLLSSCIRIAVAFEGHILVPYWHKIISRISVSDTDMNDGIVIYADDLRRQLEPRALTTCKEKLQKTLIPLSKQHIKLLDTIDVMTNRVTRPNWANEELLKSLRSSLSQMLQMRQYEGRNICWTSKDLFLPPSIAQGWSSLRTTRATIDELLAQ